MATDSSTSDVESELGSSELVLADDTKSALARLDQTVVGRVLGLAERAYVNAGMVLPVEAGLRDQVAAVHQAAKIDMATKTDQDVIKDFLRLIAERRGLPTPSTKALELDAAVMSAWPADLYRKAEFRIWERFSEQRVPNPPDFFAFISEDLAERRRQIAALHTLEKRLETIASNGGQQIPPDTFNGGTGECL